MQFEQSNLNVPPHPTPPPSGPAHLSTLLFFLFPLGLYAVISQNAGLHLFLTHPIATAGAFPASSNLLLLIRLLLIQILFPQGASVWSHNYIILLPTYCYNTLSLY